MRHSLLCLIVASLTIVAGCSSSAPAPGAAPAPSPAPATPAQSPAAAPAAAAEKPAAPPAPEYRELTIPAGTTLRLTLETTVASDTSEVEGPVRAQLARAITVDGLTAIPAGSIATGVVTQAERSGRVEGRARVGFRFDSLTAGDERYRIRTAVIAREAEGTKGEDAKKIGIGAGAGAIIGGIVGGGSGAAKGAAIGGGAGAGYVVATRGKEVKLAPGTTVTTTLTEPLTIQVLVKK